MNDTQPAIGARKNRPYFSGNCPRTMAHFSKKLRSSALNALSEWLSMSISPTIFALARIGTTIFDLVSSEQTRYRKRPDQQSRLRPGRTRVLPLVVAAGLRCARAPRCWCRMHFAAASRSLASDARSAAHELRASHPSERSRHPSLLGNQ